MMTSIPNDRLKVILERFYEIYTKPIHEDTKEHLIEMTDFFLSIDGNSVENLPEIFLIEKEVDTIKFILDFKKFVPFNDSQERIVRSFIKHKLRSR